MKEREREREGKAQQSRKNHNKKKELESQFVGDYFSFFRFISFSIQSWPGLVQSDGRKWICIKTC